MAKNTIKKLHEKWGDSESGIAEQEKALKDMITAILDDENTNQSEFLIFMRDSILEYQGEL